MIRKILAMAAAFAVLVTAHAVDADVQIISQGGQTVTLSDIDGFLQRMPANRRIGFIEKPDRVIQMVTDVLRGKQMAQLAIDQKLDQDPEVAAEIAYATREILSKAYLSSFETSLKIPSLELPAKEEYLAHKKDYTTPGTVEVQQILIAPAPDRIAIETKALADKVRAEAESNPATFDALVEKYSDDTTKAKNKGHIDDAASDKLVPTFVAAVKNLNKENEISPVVSSQYGYHIIKLIKRHPGRQLEFAEVKSKIESKLKDSYVTEQRGQFLAKLDHDKATMNPDIVSILQKRYNPNGEKTPTELAREKTH